MSFVNKVVLVTGAGSGMGQMTAILFAKEGADVVIVDCNEETANNTAEKCKEYGKRILVIKTDLSRDEEAKNAINITINSFGKLDVLVNNAGIVRKEGNLLAGDIMDTFDITLNTNLRAVVHMTSLATPHLIKTKGCIVNMSSIASKFEHKSAIYPAYTMAKAGVDSFTRIAALELAPAGVRVNAINPGPVYTNLLANGGLDRRFEDFTNLTALGRCSDPSEIAELIAFLASDKARSITGSSYLIDNGMSLL